MGNHVVFCLKKYGKKITYKYSYKKSEPIKKNTSIYFFEKNSKQQL